MTGAYRWGKVVMSATDGYSFATYIGGTAGYVWAPGSNFRGYGLSIRCATDTNSKSSHISSWQPNTTSIIDYISIE